MHFPHLVWFLGKNIAHMEKVAREVYPTATIWVVKEKLSSHEYRKLDDDIANGGFSKDIGTLVFVTMGISDIPHFGMGTVYLFPWQFSNSLHWGALNVEELSQEEFDQRCTLAWAENCAAVFVDQLQLTRRLEKKSTAPTFGQEIKVIPFPKPEPPVTLARENIMNFLPLERPTELIAIGRDLSRIEKSMSRIEKSMSLLLEHFGTKLPTE